MSCESRYIAGFVDAAEKQRWEEIDEKLRPLLQSAIESGEVNAEHVAKALLEKSNSENGDIRDVAATVLADLSISDEQLKKGIIEIMSKQAVNDEWPAAAGRAAVVLLKYQTLEQVRPKITQALDLFKNKARKNDWVNDFVENIPPLQGFFKSETE